MTLSWCANVYVLEYICSFVMKKLFSRDEDLIMEKSVMSYRRKYISEFTSSCLQILGSFTNFLLAMMVFKVVLFC